MKEIGIKPIKKKKSIKKPIKKPIKK